VLSLLRADRERGFEVGLASFPEPRLWREAGELGARLFPMRTFGTREAAPWRDWLAVGAVRRAIREFRPDLLSAHSTKAGLAARIASALERRDRPAVIFTAHGWAFGEGRARWSNWLLTRAERLAARVTDRIVCVSRYDYDLALRYRVAPEEKMVVIRNGVDPAPFEEARARREETRRRLAREAGLGEGIWVSWVGRLERPKEPEVAVRAGAILLNFLGKGNRKNDREGRGIPGSGEPASLPAYLIFIGQGPLRTEAERVAQKEGLEGKVVFLGEREDVPALLAASDIFLLSSRHEGLPLTVIEAMLAGLPVVSSRVGGVPELVEEGVTGFLVPPGDPPALARALERLVADPDLGRRMGAAGRERALLEFTRERMVRETHRVYFEEVFRRAGKEEAPPGREPLPGGGAAEEAPSGRWKL